MLRGRGTAPRLTPGARVVSETSPLLWHPSPPPHKAAEGARTSCAPLLARRRQWRLRKLRRGRGTMAHLTPGTRVVSEPSPLPCHPLPPPSPEPPRGGARTCRTPPPHASDRGSGDFGNCCGTGGRRLTSPQWRGWCPCPPCFNHTPRPPTQSRTRTCRILPHAYCPRQQRLRKLLWGRGTVVCLTPGVRARQQRYLKLLPGREPLQGRGTLTHLPGGAQVFSGVLVLVRVLGAPPLQHQRLQAGETQVVFRRDQHQRSL